VNLTALIAFDQCGNFGVEHFVMLALNRYTDFVSEKCKVELHVYYTFSSIVSYVSSSSNAATSVSRITSA
jgi:hypothetical protein